MSEHRFLNDCMAQESTWHQAAVGQLCGNQALEVQAEFYGQQLVAMVTAEDLALSDLRAGVIWVNALDKEVVDIVGAGVELGNEDRLEAIARRVAHHAGRWALSQVKSYRLRLKQQANLSRRGAAFAVGSQDM